MCVSCYLLFCCISFGDRSADRFAERLQALILWDFCVQSRLDRAFTAKNSKSMLFSGVGQSADRNWIHLRVIRGVIESNLLDKVALFLCTFFKILPGFFLPLAYFWLHVYNRRIEKSYRKICNQLFLTPCKYQRNTKKLLQNLQSAFFDPKYIIEDKKYL